MNEQDEEFHRLGYLISTLSANCAEMLRAKIKSHGYERTRHFVYIFFEFLYFLLHVTNRIAHGRLTEEQIDKLHEELIPRIAIPAIYTACEDSSDDLKSEMLDEFYEKLRQSELRYASFERLFPAKGRVDSQSALTEFCGNICELTGNPRTDYLDTYPAVYKLVMNAIEEIDFSKRMSGIKVVLEESD